MLAQSYKQRLPSIVYKTLVSGCRQDILQTSLLLGSLVLTQICMNLGKISFQPLILQQVLILLTTCLVTS